MQSSAVSEALAKTLCSFKGYQDVNCKRIMAGYAGDFINVHSEILGMEINQRILKFGGWDNCSIFIYGILSLLCAKQIEFKNSCRLLFVLRIRKRKHASTHASKQDMKKYKRIAFSLGQADCIASTRLPSCVCWSLCHWPILFYACEALWLAARLIHYSYS